MKVKLAQENGSFLLNLCGQFSFTNSATASLFDINDIYTHYLRLSLEKSTGRKWNFIDEADDSKYIVDLPGIKIIAQMLDTYENMEREIVVETAKLWEDLPENTNQISKWCFTDSTGHYAIIRQAANGKYYISLVDRRRR